MNKQQEEKLNDYYTENYIYVDADGQTIEYMDYNVIKQTFQAGIESALDGVDWDSVRLYVISKSGINMFCSQVEHFKQAILSQIKENQ